MNLLKEKYKWGPNSFYYLAGKYGIHPTYIQEMLNIKMDDVEILEAIKQLKNGDGKKYDVNLIRSEFQKPIKLKKETGHLKKDLIKKRSFLNFFRSKTK